MYAFRRNIKPAQRFEYGIYQILDHFFGRARVFKIVGKRRRTFYKNVHATLKASGEGKIIPIERRTDLSLKEFKDIKAPLKNINLELLGFKEKYNIHNETSVTSSQKK